MMVGNYNLNAVLKNINNKKKLVYFTTILWNI